MPRYFFHSEDGIFERDVEGTELPDDVAARVEGVRLAGDILRDRPQLMWEATRWRIVVVPKGRSAIFGIEVNPVSGEDLEPWST